MLSVTFKESKAKNIFFRNPGLGQTEGLFSRGLSGCSWGEGEGSGTDLRAENTPVGGEGVPVCGATGFGSSL